jgi:hypothetical protein
MLKNSIFLFKIKEFETKSNPAEALKKKHKEDEIINFDPLKLSAVFYGQSFAKVQPDDPRFFNVTLIF